MDRFSQFTPAGKEMQGRHRAWLQRVTFAKTTAGKSVRRPKTIYRSAATKWVLAIDARIRISTGKPGLSFFKEAEHTVWYNRPHLSIAQDLGSDGNSGFFALERLFGINSDQFNDGSHGLNCDFRSALQLCQL